MFGYIIAWLLGVPLILLIILWLLGIGHYDDRDATPPTVTRTYVFRGGCITERFLGIDRSPQRLASEASASIGFVTREALDRDLRRRSDGRLRLNPP